MRKGDFVISQSQAANRIHFSPSEYVGQCAHLYGIYSMLPEQESWAYDSGESLVMQMEDGAGPGALWAAHMEDITALCLVLAWKAREATSVSVHALNERALSAAAMTARGAFEAATAAINHVVMLNDIKTKLAKPGNQERTVAALLERLESSSIRGIWGRKGGVFEGEIRANHFFDHQRSVIKFAEGNATFGPEIVKNHAIVYETLCSMAHPSADGHQPYMVLPPVTESTHSTQRIPLKAVPDFRTPQAMVLLEGVLWALGWSAAHAVRAWQLAEADRREARARL